MKCRGVRVRVFPSSQEIIVDFAAVLTVPLHGVGPRGAELHQRSKHSPREPSAMTDELLELGGSLGVISRGQVGLCSGNDVDDLLALSRFTKGMLEPVVTTVLQEVGCAAGGGIPWNSGSA